MHEGNWLNLIPQELQLSHFLLILWYKIFSIQWTKSGSVCYLLCKSPDKASCVYANIDKSSKVCLPGMTGRLHSSFVVFYFVFVLWRCCDVNRGAVFFVYIKRLTHKKRAYKDSKVYRRIYVSPSWWEGALCTPYLVVIKAYYRASWADLSAFCFPSFLVPESDVCESVLDK